MKKLFGHIKSFVDIWKVWIFFAAILFGTNGAQMYANSEPASEKQVKTVSTPSNLQKTVIIHKVDNSYCDKQLNEHKTGAQH